MLILAIETSTPHASVALVRNTGIGVPELLGTESFESDRSHNALLFRPLQRLLAMGKPEAVVVGTGPGTYTGIRIGIAAAHGLATGLGIPWGGWNSLAALSEIPKFYVVGDARRGGFFVASIENGCLIGAPMIYPVEQMEEIIDGIACPLYTTDAKPLHARLEKVRPAAAKLARFARQALANEKGVEPLYLRAPFITEAKPRKLR